MRAEDRRALDRAAQAWQALAATGGAALEPLWSEITSAREALAQAADELETEGFHEGGARLGGAYRRLAEAHAALAGTPGAHAPFAALRTLAGDIAHDFGRPEAAVRLLVGALQAAPIADRRLDDRLEADLNRMREMARRQAAHAAGQGEAPGQAAPSPQQPAAPAAKAPGPASQQGLREHGQALLVEEPHRGAGPWLVALALAVAVVLLLWAVLS